MWDRPSPDAPLDIPSIPVSIASDPVSSLPYIEGVPAPTEVVETIAEPTEVEVEVVAEEESDIGGIRGSVVLKASGAAVSGATLSF